MMDIIVNLLFLLHFIGLSMGVGGGIALGLTGPRLKTATGVELELVWTMEAAFSKVASLGVIILLVTGPMMVWLKFGGFSGFSGWFDLKMGFVSLAVIGAATHEWAGRRHRAGHGSYRVKEISGRLAGGSMIAAILCAVSTFN